MSQLVLPLGFPFDDPSLPYQVVRMCADDIEKMMHIERKAFPSPWPASAYHYELTQNDLSTYLVLKLCQVPPPGRRLRQDPSQQPILAYGGFWLIVDEAHISTIATHPDWRGRGLGEMMLVALIEVAMLRGAVEATLEARVSNVVAQGLYRKYAFAVVGRRKGYYRDKNEDALIMTTPRLDSPDFLARYARLKTALKHRLAGTA
jgi:ribosomal-protein-alanine N-acetyltransferase